MCCNQSIKALLLTKRLRNRNTAPPQPPTLPRGARNSLCCHFPRGAPRSLSAPLPALRQPLGDTGAGGSGTETLSPELSASPRTLRRRMLEGASPLRGFSYVRSAVSGLMRVSSGVPMGTPLLFVLLGPSPFSPGPLCGSVLKCAASYRGAWQRATYQQGKKRGFKPVWRIWGGPERASFALCAAEELWPSGGSGYLRYSPLRPPAPSTAKRHPGAFLWEICTNPWKGRRGREGEREGGK